ncbi:MAG: DUF3575 domain-containing protein [Spirosomataceae bacterium]
MAHCSGLQIERGRRIFRKKRIWVIAILCLTGVAAKAQDTLRPAAVLKFTPSMLLDLDNTLTLGAEMPFGKRWGVQQEVGWGSSFTNLWNEHSVYPDKNNWRFRTQLRYYFSNPYSTSGGWYFAMEYFRKEIFIRQYQAFGRQCNTGTGTCAYFEEGILRTRRRVSALHGKFGFQWLIPDRMIFDIYIGGGFRKLLVTNDDPLGQANTNLFRTDVFNLRTLRPGRYEAIPSISAGFSLGFLLKQKKRKVVPLRS